MAKEKEVKFEDKMVELETIINELENGEVDLDSSIEKYTRAMKLVNECDEKLKSVEEQVNKIVKEEFKKVPYELKSLMYFYNTYDNNYLELEKFLRNEYRR